MSTRPNFIFVSNLHICIKASNLAKSQIFLVLKGPFLIKFAMLKIGQKISHQRCLAFRPTWYFFLNYSWYLHLEINVIFVPFLSKVIFSFDCVWFFSVYSLNLWAFFFNFENQYIHVFRQVSKYFFASWISVNGWLEIGQAEKSIWNWLIVITVSDTILWNNIRNKK